MSAQDFERSWWGDCSNTFHEEEKQTVYAHHMGLIPVAGAAHPPTYDLGGRAVVDIGGGPASMLLKTVNAGPRTVVDPCPYPSWVTTRYAACGILHLRTRGEDFRFGHGVDEVWIYNVLQHVNDPRLVIENAWRHARVVRLFEWIDVPAHEGHPHELSESSLMNWLSRGDWMWDSGGVVEVNSRGAVGRAFAGVFERV